MAAIPELKIDRGVETPRAIRQWKKYTKEKTLNGIVKRKSYQMPSVEDRLKSKTKPSERNKKYNGRKMNVVNEKCVNARSRCGRKNS